MRKCRNCKNGSPTGEKVGKLKVGLCFNNKARSIKVVENGTCSGFKRGIPWEKGTQAVSKQSKAQVSKQTQGRRSVAQTKQGTTTRRKRKTGTLNKDTK